MEIMNCGGIIMTDRDRLGKLIGHKQCYGTPMEDSVKSISNEALAEYLLANGVIVLPCTVGAEIFGIFDNDDEQRKEIYVGKILCYSLDENNLLWARMRYKNGLTYWHTIDDFDKTVFLTPEEAKKALEGYKENTQKEK